MAKTIRMWIDDTHKNSVEHGWWDGKPSYDDRIDSIPQNLLLIHSEVSEAANAFANNKIETYEIDGKPEGVFAELADVVLRAFDLAGACGVDLEHLIELKHAYNKTRPYRHGNKRI